jgi:3D-(3,5/4)-trihydroxycyclohexane-1,2-dione acylhydrolase (decyclizing)
VECAQEEGLRFYRPQHEQGMVHISAAFAKHRNRLSTFACTTSIGPGALNMVTGAGVATVNRHASVAFAERLFCQPREITA